ncbi:hypothetical protein [Clostridium sp. CF012]|nr:hypothetical protein [Clostridium sp. CF012]MBU3143566.1 hypothetical protein [Clostridium sp. CF012]
MLTGNFDAGDLLVGKSGYKDDPSIKIAGFIIFAHLVGFCNMVSMKYL